MTYLESLGINKNLDIFLINPLATKDLTSFKIPYSEIALEEYKHSVKAALKKMDKSYISHEHMPLYNSIFEKKFHLSFDLDSINAKLKSHSSFLCLFDEQREKESVSKLEFQVNALLEFRHESVSFRAREFERDHLFNIITGTLGI